MASRAVASKVDWGNIISKLGLTGSTATSLLAFRKRNDDAKSKVRKLESESTTVDFEHYKKVLNNQKIVSEIEAAFKSYKPVTYDVSKQLKVIDAFEAEAKQNAVATQNKVKEEIALLHETVKNIESARAFEDLVVDDINAAVPDVEKKVSELVKKGKWSAPGYEEKFGSTVVM